MPKSGAERTKTWWEKKRASEGIDQNRKRKKSRTEIERDSRERRQTRANLLRDSVDDSVNNPENELLATTSTHPPPDCDVYSGDRLQYSDFNKSKTAHKNFHRDFINNPFGFTCCNSEVIMSWHAPAVARL
ncbi:uncharacterized protein LOC135164267 [Diachasmimorpha longicaudata]|uniref:uncharacterized protein LOC135164267 n=1 Tax=Diachasmimorpha longicaudata TaxID=58733 RepID=UPI0030B91691